jgi:tetratricopeptide (TPR) repeat protein
VPNRVLALLVGVFTLVLYRITLSPDVSFWDAGEFIATSVTMGIPHPPGTPLYVLLGRVFTLFFHDLLGIASPAVAVNLLSALPGAIAASFLYLCVVRIGKKMWNDGDQSSVCPPAMLAGVTAALFASFANTLWINSIEAEVYSVSMMWTIFTTWIVLLWADSDPRDERLLVVIAYLLALNIGVHLATFLVALAVLPFAFLYERRLAIPVSFALVLCMAQDLWFFLVVVALMLLPTLQHGLLPREYQKRNRVILMAAHVVAVLLALYGAFMMEASTFRSAVVFGGPILAFLVPWIAIKPPTGIRNPATDLGFLLALTTFLGFSVHLYLPIRSALDPVINEAQPDTWNAFWDMILRAQYKPRSIFDRQADFLFQTDHMFWRYFRQQWGTNASGFLLPLLGIPGAIAHFRRERRSFVLIGLLFLWTSFMLILKMNFTDHEVRERDYFFAPGFFYYAPWMGLGLAWLARQVVAGVSGRGARRAVAVLTGVLCLTIAAVPIQDHWETHDRRGNFVARDYAYNMLVGLEENAIIFTNGDNDTFPLWYIQGVEGFRTDVRLVNLSLLNTPWYGQQLRDEEPRVPMSYTVEELWKLRPFMDQESRKVYLVKDQVAMNIINENVARGMEVPVYFAVTVDDLLGLEPYLELEGLAFKFHLDSSELKDVNLEICRNNLEEKYLYRGLLDEEGYLDDSVFRNSNESKLVTNYAAAWARMGLLMREEGDMDEALACMERATRIAPDYAPISGGYSGLLIEAGRYEEARSRFLDRLEASPGDLKVVMALAFIEAMQDHWAQARSWYEEAQMLAPSDPEVLSGLYSAYMNLDLLPEAENVLARWLDDHPDDESVRSKLMDLRVQIKAGIPPRDSS